MRSCRKKRINRPEQEFFIILPRITDYLQGVINVQ